MTKNSPKPLQDKHLQPDTDRPDTDLPKRKRGRQPIEYPATVSPTHLDIARAAEYYECEGHITINQGQDKVDIGQNDREKLDWLRDRFGGRVYGPSINMAGNDCYHLIIVRDRAIGFLFTIYSFLSQSRKEQFLSILAGTPQKRRYQKTISSEGISEAWLNKKLSQHIKTQNKKPTRRASVMSIFGVKK